MMVQQNPSDSARCVPSSFRDPSGFVYQRDGEIYRQINPCYARDFSHLLDSHLYQYLTERHLLIEHEVVGQEMAFTQEAWRVIRPRQIPFFSYPYEWSFSQLKDAALLTLKIQKAALDHGMILKDASAYNVQFVDGRPLFIDTLSFEIYREGRAWDAYKQFCQHFLAPLLLMRQHHLQLVQMLRLYMDGIPLDLASRLLGKRTYFQPNVFMHIHLHSWLQKPSTPGKSGQGSVKKSALLNIVQNLSQFVESLSYRKLDTQWADYYDGDSYAPESFEHKKTIIDAFVTRVQPGFVLDLGANTGVFSRIASAKGISTIAIDVDPGAVELNYRQVKQHGETHLLPLLVDLMNISPALGWASSERASLLERSRADMVFALALIHHLSIANNVPFAQIAAFMAQLAPWLVIEFVPKSDPKVQLLLQHRRDIFADYTRENFEAAFSHHFEIVAVEPIVQSERSIYLMHRR